MKDHVAHHSFRVMVGYGLQPNNGRMYCLYGVKVAQPYFLSK